MSDGMWMLIATFAPFPLVWLTWALKGWRQTQREAKEVRDFMAARRDRYGGAIRPPGSKDVTPFNRP